LVNDLQQLVTDFEDTEHKQQHIYCSMEALKTYFAAIETAEEKLEETFEEIEGNEQIELEYERINKEIQKIKRVVTMDIRFKKVK